MLQTFIDGFVGILPYMVVAFGLWMVYRLIHDRLTSYDDKTELASGNTAAGLVRGGAYLGVALAASGSLVGSDEPHWHDLLMFSLDGGVAVVVFTAACFAFDAVILRRIKNDELIRRGNMAVAVLEASAYVGLGIVMNASFSGGGQALLPGLGSAVLFSSLGMGSLVLIYVVFETLYRAFKKCSVEREVEKGNVAVAMEASGVVLGMSTALWFSIQGDFIGWWQDIASYGIAAASSTIAVGLGWFVSGRLLTGVKHAPLQNNAHHGNVATAAVRMCVLVGFGVIAGLVTFA